MKEQNNKQKTEEEKNIDWKNESLELKAKNLLFIAKLENAIEEHLEAIK